MEDTRKQNKTSKLKVVNYGQIIYLDKRFIFLFTYWKILCNVCTNVEDKKFSL